MPKILGIDTITLLPDAVQGTVPLGAIIPIASDLAATQTIPAAGVILDGYMYCDGSVVPAGSDMTGETLPDLTGDVYLRGSSVAGTTSGANTFTLNIPQLPPHGHSVSVNTNPANVTHDHEPGTSALSANAPHDHPHRHSQSITAASPGGSTTGIKNTSVTNPGPAYSNGIFQQGLALSPTLAIPANAPHTHGVDVPTENIPHSHPVTLNQSNVGSGDSISNEPKFLSTQYLIRVA